ncbi:MAG: hypothetical protein NVSMB56_11900 [Pyrinomonadaceae bacterium]
MLFMRVKIANWLIAKSIIEVLFVVALVVVAQYRAFNPYFRGDAEATKGGRIAGWVVDAASPTHRVEIQLFIDGRFVAQSIADKPRPDVRDTGRAFDQFCGIEFAIPELADGTHEARVYAVHSSDEGNRKTLQLINHPVVFHSNK